MLLTVSALGASATTTVFALWADGMAVALPLRVLTGVFLAGVYPVGMKIMASGSPSERRGRSLGILIGAPTLGSALPHVIGTIDADWRLLMGCAAAATALGALTAACLLRTGPFMDSVDDAEEVPETAPAQDSRFLRTIVTERRPRLINIGYLGHMWELCALWTWFPLFAGAAVAGSAMSSRELSLWTFLVIGVAGVVGCLVGGRAADRVGRRTTAAVALAVSGLCCLLSPLMFTAGPVVMLVLAAVWGASVIADSGVFSTMLSENVDARFAGTALTMKTATGFLLTVVSIQAVSLLAEVVTWQYALMLLALGPAAGIVAMLRYR